MSRLPIIGGDYDAWGTVLNDYLTDTTDWYSLASGTSVGATAIVLNIPAAAPVKTGGLLVVDAFTSQAEVRAISSVSGTTINLTTALSYAHSGSDRVFAVTTDGLTTDVWDCKSDGTTDDSVALQEAIEQTTGNGLWLDGRLRNHVVTLPIILANGAYLRRFIIKAAASFAPADNNNAVLMSTQGAALSFTGSGSTDFITTGSAHGLPADNIGVVFKGTSLPSGLTAGRLYYCRDRTANTFKVSLTSGGAAIDLTSDGSGTVYCEVLSMAKLYLDDVQVNGNSVANSVGYAGTLQQPSYWNKARFNNLQVGMKVGGQQCVFFNTEIVSCGDGIVLGEASLEAAQFMWFFGTNVEGINEAAIGIHDFGATQCLFDGVHIESLDSDAVAIEILATAYSMGFHNVHASMGFDTQTVVLVNTGNAQNSSYIIDNLRVSGFTDVGLPILNDVDRGLSIDSWGETRNFLQYASAAPQPTSAVYTDPSPYIVVRPGGGYLAYGAQIDTQPSLHLKPGSAQTGDLVTARDTSGNRVSGFNKAGVLFTERNSAPADGDLVAGELTFWLDDTNGACKVMFKAKQADGTVRTGNVALA